MFDVWLLRLMFDVWLCLMFDVRSLDGSSIRARRAALFSADTDFFAVSSFLMVSLQVWIVNVFSVSTAMLAIIFLSASSVSRDADVTAAGGLVTVPFMACSKSDIWSLSEN